MIEAQLDGAKTQDAPAVATGDVPDRVRQFVLTNFYVADANALANSASLLDGGVIDSTGVLEVIAFVESEFGIQVGDDEIVPENLDSIDRIAGFVTRKRAA